MRCLTALLVVGVLLLTAMTAGLYSWGRGVDWQRQIDKERICRAYPSPAAVTGMSCP